MNSVTDKLLSEYEIDTGFIGRLRHEQIFDQIKAERYIHTLAQLEVLDGHVSIELAQILWNLPIVLQWQADRAKTVDEKRLIDDVLNKTLSILEDRIGVP